MNKQQIKRIEEMERCLDSCLDTYRKLQDALNAYEETADQFQKLAGYYESSLWKKDFEAYENGTLPSDLKCGVLSEDAVYNLLDDMKELKEQAEELLRQNCETNKNSDH